GQEEEEVEQDRDDQVGDRTGRQHQIAGPQRLVGQRSVAILLGYLLVGILAEQGHVAAERDRGQAVFGLADPPPQQRRPEPDREASDLDVHELGREQVTELVNEDQRTDQEDEGEELAHGPAYLAQKSPAPARLVDVLASGRWRATASPRLRDCRWSTSTTSRSRSSCSRSPTSATSTASTESRPRASTTPSSSACASC